MYNRRYDRKTVILKQETDSFSKKAGQTAVAAIEIKNGQGRINLQGKINEGSHIYLVGADRGSNICADLGQVGKTSFNPENVAGSGKAIENFDILVMGKRQNDEKFDWSVYVGFFNGRREWRRNMITVEKNEDKSQPVAMVDNSQGKEELQSQKEKLVEQANINEVEPPTEEVNFGQKEETVCDHNGKEEITQQEVTQQKAAKQGIAIKEALKKQTKPLEAKILELAKNTSNGQQMDVHDTFKRIVQSFNKEMKNLEDIGVLSLSELMEIQGFNVNEKDEECLEEAEKKENEVDYIFKHNEKMNPFNNEECQWVRICPEEIWALGLKDNAVNNSSFLMYADKKYKHLLLGRRESGMLILGVPDCYKASERRRAMALGFVDFFGVGDKIMKEGEHGYWIKNLR
ncbi:MAG TPA: hypothetical protein DIC60_09145 [Lachnospiraceae bacterium]|nr:hypothetical protein [Lachnospiraceae bacterium]